MSEIGTNVSIVDTGTVVITSVTSDPHIPQISYRADPIVVNGFNALSSLGTSLLATAKTILGDLGKLTIDQVDLPEVTPLGDDPSIEGSISTPTYATEEGVPAIPQDVNFAYSEDPYLSTLLDTLRGKLYTWLNTGVSGLSRATREAMFLQGSEKEILLRQELRDKVASEWAERGLDLPDGILIHELAKIDAEYQDKRTEKVRKITEESQKIAIETNRLVIEQTRQIETALMGYAAGKEDRKIRVAEGILKASSDIIDVILKHYNALADVDKTNARVYSAYVSALSSLNSARAGLMSTIISAKTQVAEAQIKIDEANLSVNMQDGVLQATAKAAEANAKASLAGSAISGVNVNTSVSRSEGKSQSTEAPAVDVASW